ncbi:MAG: hypothetical protein JW860_07460, partial [Sedimentisphaerales bacterium]|nr:hypothetical protein [Sedimentisphaerales bacterium]
MIFPLKQSNKFIIEYIPLCLSIAGVMLVSGCQKQNKSPAKTLADPIITTNMALNPQLGQNLLSSCQNQDSPSSNNLISELLLSYVKDASELNDIEKPRRFILRVIPLNNNFETIQIRGQVTIAVFTAPTDSNYNATPEPLMLWDIGPEKLAQYWLPTGLLDGYLFQLLADETCPI